MSRLNPLLWPKPHVMWSYAIALVTVTAAVLIIRLPVFHLQQACVSVLLCAVMFSAWFGGAWPGLLATFCSALAFYNYFLPPIYSLEKIEQTIPRLIMFVLSAVLVGSLSAAQRSGTESLRRARDELKRSEFYLSEAERLAHIGCWAWSSTSDEFTYFSEEALRIIGLEPARPPVPFAEFFQRIPPDDKAAFLERFRKAEFEKADYESYHRIVHPNGAVRHVHCIGQPVLSPSGDLVELVGTFIDATERKRAEEALRSAAEFDEAALKSLGEGLYTIDTNGLVTSMNPAAEELFGWSFAELRGKKMHEMTHHHYPDGRPFPSSECAGFQVLTHGRPLKNYEDVFIRKDGTFFEVVYSIAPMRDAAGQINSLVVVFSDITERKRTESELRESEARFRLVADSAPVMIWMSGTDKLCTYFNKPWLDFTGRSIDRELGNGWAEGVDPKDLQRCLVTYEHAFDRREAFRMEYHLRRHDGEFRWVLDMGVPRFNPDGSFAGYIGSCIDVTEHRRAEEQLRQAQTDLAHISRVTTMGELTASVAHEVNQPIAAAVTNANTCLRWLDGDVPNIEEARAAATRIVEDGTRAANIINRIRVLFRKGTSKRELVDVNEVIREMIVLLRDAATQHSISTRTELATDLPPVRGDRVQLQQVIMNLMINGFDAMKDMDGTRELTIRSQRSEDDQVFVSVSDTGVGLPAEQADQIFNPFFTTKPHGTGMGLSISRSIVESHGGRLWAVENSPHGARFYLILPTRTEAEE